MIPPNTNILELECLFSRYSCAQTNQTTHTSEAPQTAASALTSTSHLDHQTTLLPTIAMSSSKKSSSSSSRKSRSQPEAVYGPPYSSYGTTYSSTSPFWTIGTLFGASSVALGAFGAHALKQRISDPAKIASWGNAAHYQVCILLSLLSRPLQSLLLRHFSPC